MSRFPYPPLPAKNYQSPGVPVKSSFGASPNEGPQIVDLRIKWGSANDGGTNNTVAVDLSNRGPLDFTIIQSMAVDNSRSGADVQFVFQDTGETISVPAYTPYTVYPVFTNRVTFIVQAPDALSTDITNVIVANYVMPQIAVPTTQEQNYAVADAIDISTSGSQQLIAATNADGSDLNGTLENAFFFLSLIGSSSNPKISWQLTDGNSNIIAGGSGAINSTAFINGPAYQLTDGHIRFQKGLSLTWTSTNVVAGSVLSANLYYRTP